jgi:hypothetical protein
MPNLGNIFQKHPDQVSSLSVLSRSELENFPAALLPIRPKQFNANDSFRKRIILRFTTSRR